MLLKVFTVYDSKAEFYMQPFCMKSKGEAIRAFSESCNDDKTSLGKYPADFTLFEIGEFDDAKGTYLLHNTLINCGIGNEFVKS